MSESEMTDEQITEDVRRMIEKAESVTLYGPFKISFDDGQTWYEVNEENNLGERTTP